MGILCFHIQCNSECMCFGELGAVASNALVKVGVSSDLDIIFEDDATVDSFLKAFQDNPGLSIHNTNDAFKFKN
jgi:hypothetical protein